MLGRLSLRIVTRLAKGGMGVVYVGLREEGHFRRLYAVKRLHPHLSDDAAFRAMFLDEARIAGLVQHPNVVGVLDVGEDHEGPFMVMEYIDGVNLAELVDAARARGLAIPMQIVVRIAKEVARGLGAVHELTTHDGEKLHLVHRDLSPQNVLLGFDGSVRITDFGIAKALGRLTHTGAGTLKGKLAYASPEQMLCLPLDHRSDLFSLGVVVHETLTGRQLYGNTSDDDGSRRLIHDAPPDVGEERPDTPPELAELLFRMLAKDRERRPASADEVHQELEVLLSDLVSREGPLDLQAFVSDVAKDVREGRKQQVDSAVALATEVHATEVRAKRARRLRTGAVALGIAAVLGGAGGLALTFGADSEEPRPIEAPQIALPSVTPAPPAEATPEPRPPEPAVAEPAERPRARARRREATSNERRTLGRWGFDDR